MGSPSLPGIRPSSMFGTSIPLKKTPEPMPVPMVSMMTVPMRPRPAPSVVSAMPATSASL